MSQAEQYQDEICLNQAALNDIPSFRIVGLPEDKDFNESVHDFSLSRENKKEILDFAQSVLLRESQAILDQTKRLNEDFCDAVSIILHGKGKLIISGMGKAGQIGMKLAATFSSTGTPSHFLHPSEAIHGDLGVVCSNDILLILSNSGETEEIVRILPSLKKMRTPIISITTMGSSLSRFSDIVLQIGKQIEADSLNLAPSSSTTVMLALGDALALSVSRLRGFDADDFARFHPGGSLGRKLSLVEDHMRPISQCRVSSDQQTIREIFVESSIPGRRSGAILLVDSEFQLTGIFTDSDLAKLFERRDDSFFDSPVCELMTKNPKSIALGTRMSEAVAFMGNKKISELPVLDDHGIPVGILDITDLVAFFPKNNEV
ncbi:MAG: KpsF/GutQ family sugar-phosphate isomerase [Planctomycetia bacterium]|nr:KpsF/GutQ family sugar-phosphate isomerase [Planctomycetia bacterium]